MTRTGKSNTTKIILQSVFRLRDHAEKPIRIGQLVFDPNGEYANENTQDADGQGNPSAIKNVSGKPPNEPGAEVVTYGITSHPKDPGRRMMLIDFFAEDNLQTGKEIIDGFFSGDQSGYIKNFRGVRFGTQPMQEDFPDVGSFRSANTRYNRRVFVYRALLTKAGFEPSPQLMPSLSGLFGQDLRTAMQNSGGRNNADFQSAAVQLAAPNPSWAQSATALAGLAQFIADRDSGYGAFEQAYVQRPNSTGENWADADLRSLLEMFRYNLGRLIGQARSHHSSSIAGDYTDVIYDDLLNGHLVIVDQASGDPDLNNAQSRRLMTYIFKQNQVRFTRGELPPEILIYIEEAHNLLPSGKEDDTKDIWVRTAKEGAKYHIGMVYATQEVSSIQKNILKATSNWFIAHLNNTDETRELSKYYDFADFEPSIRRAQDPGFLRVKTRSNPFVIPVQVRRFET